MRQGPASPCKGKGRLCYSPIPVLLALALLLSPTAGVFGEGWSIPMGELERPRSAEDWLAWPQLRQLMAELGNEPDTTLLIRHPGGDRGELRAHWLAGQLVALGLPWERIEMRTGGVSSGTVELNIKAAVAD